MGGVNVRPFAHTFSDELAGTILVDPDGETKDWTGEVSYVTPVVEKTAPKAANAVAVLCGPPIVVKLTLPLLDQLGFADDAIFTTLENRMKCGFGKCGRCNIEPVYVCEDGRDVFDADVHDKVDVVGGSGFALKTRGKGARQHVADARRFERRCDLL